MLQIENLHAAVSGKEILKGLNLNVQEGETHAIMGPNGSGKSTLAKVLCGHPDYEVTEGKVDFEVNLRPKSLLEMPPEERARQGIFLGFQYPVEIPGVSHRVLLRAAYNAVCKQQGAAEMSEEEFDALLEKKCMELGYYSDHLDQSDLARTDAENQKKMREKFIFRDVNVALSGGEKKRNEILQMAVLQPRLAFLDETDSGLDIDSLRIVAEGVKKIRNKEAAVVLVTHYQRLLDYIEPDHVHVLYQGRIVKSGDKSLAKEIEQRGYDWIVKGLPS